MSGAPPRLVVVGDPRHGVVRCAATLAAAVAEHTGGPTATDLEPPLAARLHLHFTDRLWGASPEAAAGRIEALAARAALTVTLHDLPQASDGPERRARRAAAYRRVARVARGVAVTSRHEAGLLAAVLAPEGGPAPAVIPLPVDVLPPGEPGPLEPEVAVLGFFYPGKGHAEVVAAVAALAGRGDAAGLGVTVLGAPSPGHEDELAALADDAARQGIRLTVTGHVDDAALITRCRRVAVPVAAHQHVSASGSVATWIATGRRPLVPDTAYSREIDALRPGTLTRYAPGELPAAVERALREPASTWWAPGALTAPDAADTAAAYLAWWVDGVAW